MLSVVVPLILLLVGCYPQGNQEREPASAAAELEGIWSVQSWLQDGNERPGPRRVKFGSRKYWVEFDPALAPPSSKGVIEYDYTLDTTNDPKRIVCKIGSTGSVVQIYRMHDDILEICYNLEDKLRNTAPESFEANKGSQKVLIKLQREK